MLSSAFYVKGFSCDFFYVICSKYHIDNKNLSLVLKLCLFRGCMLYWWFTELDWYLLPSFWLKTNGCHFTDEIFEYIFWNDITVFWLRFHWSFILRGPIDNTSALVQVTVLWRNVCMVMSLCNISDLGCESHYICLYLGVFIYHFGTKSIIL